MPLRDWGFLIAAIGHISFALISIARAGKSPLALPFSILAFDLFGWTLATFFHHQVGGEFWRGVDVVFTALTPAFVFNVVLNFVGRLGKDRWIARIVWATFGALAGTSASSLFSTTGQAWVESRAWAVCFLTGWLPTFAYEVWLLVRHLQLETDEAERGRTGVILGAVVLGSACASTDLWNDVGATMPALAPFGTLVATSLLGIVALRFQLFDRNLGARSTLIVLGAAIVGVLLIFVALGRLVPYSPKVGVAFPLGFGAGTSLLIFAAVLLEWAIARKGRRERANQFAILGRYSAQMVHDLKNPLAALMGAVQILETERIESGQPPNEFLDLVLLQAKRVRAVVDRYDRVGRVEAVRSLVAINALVHRVVEANAAEAEARGIAIAVEGDETLQDCDVDPDLVAGALENLIRNALESMHGEGRIVVEMRREVSAISSRGEMISLSVTDDGEGMDARQRERAFDEFYTTKKEGSGLGLAFVQRVALAHGGDATLTSRRGAGTRVTMRIPRLQSFC